jgi:fatty-acyl-CoA synthase
MSNVAGERRGRAWRVYVLVLGVLLLAVGVLLIVSGPALFRIGLVDRDTGRFGMTGIAMYVLLGAVGVGLLGLVMSLLGKVHRGAIVAVLLMVAAGMGAGTLYAQSKMKEQLPPINDVQTDWALPVAFSEKTLRQRENADAIRVRDDAIVPEGNGDWSGLSFADAQKRFYIDIAPLKVKQAPPQATLEAAKAARRLGWDVMLESPPDGMVEAVYRSPWYDLVYDVAVRVVPDGQGSRIDVRATSRTNDRDMGEAATQLKQLIDEMALQLR